MIPLLFAAIGAESALAALLLVKTPLRKLALLFLDRLKRGRGRIAVRTVAAAVFAVLASSIYGLVKIWRRVAEEGGVLGGSAADQVLWSRRLLEASLLGSFLSLMMIIDRIHHYIKELRVLRKNVDSTTKHSRLVEEGRKEVLEKLKAREEEIRVLKENISNLEMVLESRLKEVKSAEANALALRKQSEGFLLEYDRLLEENQSLRNQLQYIDQRLSRSNSKKNS